MKEKNNVFIMGDSYSTYRGYIPEGYLAYYSDEREQKPIVKGVEKTWWRILARENNLNIILNDSFSGSTVCNTVRETLTVESSFISRMDQYIAKNVFSENKVDTMFIFGGTNDSWIGAPIGSLTYSSWTAEDLKCVLPAFCYLLDRAKTVVENVGVIINTNLKEEITKGFIEACEKNGIPYLLLENIDKENGHPTELGMRQIAEQVSVTLLGRKPAVHHMKLFPEPYEKIKSGRKTIELRLFDEKRRQIKAGDAIVFTNMETNETVSATVAKLHRFDSFEELYRSLPLLQCGYTAENVGEAKPSDMDPYYSAEEQKQYGVVGIELC